MVKPSQFPSPARRLRSFFLLFAAIGTAVLACYDSVPTAPGLKSRQPVNPRRDVNPLPPKEAGLPPTPGTRVFIETYPFPEQVVAEGKITGTVQITSDPLARWQVNESKDYRGYSQSSTLGTQCAISASFAWGVSASPGMPCSGGNPASIWIDTIRVMDSVWAVRGPPISESSGQCGAGVPCHDYPSATTTLTLKPLAAALIYTATPAFRTLAEMTAYYAPYTAFRGAAIPDMLGAFSTPKRFLQRAWHKADPSVPPWNTDVNGYCPQTIPVCDLPIRESGIFWAKERINGVEREDSVAINCFSGDSLLDFLAGRKAFMDALNSSHPTDYWKNRKEQAFAIVEVTNLPGHFEVIQLPDPGADACSMHLTEVTPDMIPGRKIRAYVHIHPGKLGEWDWCPAGNDSSFDMNGAGLSDSDFVTMDTINKHIEDNYGPSWKPVPFYVMDLEFVYRQPPGQPVTFSRDVLNAKYFASGRCKWVRPTPSQVPEQIHISFDRKTPFQ